MSGPTAAPSAEFDLLGDSWEKAMEADGYAPDTEPTEATRDHFRGWLVALRRQRSQNTARTYYAVLFVDGGLRLAELAGLTTDDVDVRDRMVYVVGKGSGRRGPRKRAVPLGIKATQAPPGRGA